MWMVPVMFSAAQKALNCGNQVFISAGASVPGVLWNSISTPSMVTVSKACLMVRLGAIKPRLPLAAFLPMAMSTWP
ncbi:hypothetical protein D3C76_1280060 [compost metagenome]